MTTSTVTPAPAAENWDEQKDRLKVRLPELVDTDLNFIKSKKDEMLARIQIRLGKSKEELSAIISEL
ncbi:hypothetical protein WSM22_45940 [Cytophagales bacterium WSM2-2]|nr:hypothetical protein WSM22_45940 [Cytophagales bacterium WSM2-2]